MRKLKSIQVLRAVAAGAVLVLHAAPEDPNPNGSIHFGSAGVDLFFVISGFIMAHVAQGRTAKEFLRDRAWRIYPLWWIAVLPWLFILTRSPSGIVASITLWPIYPGGYYVPSLGVGWTLGFELAFYAAVALALATRPTIPLLVYGLLFGLAFLTRSAFFTFLGSPMALEFLMGVLVSRLPRRPALALLMPLAVALIALSPPSLGMVESLMNPLSTLLRAVAWGGPAALVLWGALSIEHVFERPLFRGLVKLGDASYSIYLFHPIIAYGFDMPMWLRMIVAVFVGLAMHEVVEKRILGVSRRWTRRGSSGIVIQPGPVPA